MQGMNRWVIATAGVFLPVALGAVYAWSVFRIPLAKQFGWSISEVTLTFTIAIFVLGIAAFFGGLWLNRKGPRIVAVTGGTLYGLGVFLASLSAHKLWWLYLSYGLIGGVGLGFGYIVPVAVLLKWFPDPGIYYRGRRRRVWSRRSDHRAFGNTPHSQRRRFTHVCLSGDRVSDRDGVRRIVHAESAQPVEAGGLDAHGFGIRAPRRA